MAELPLGPHHHVAAVLDELFLHELGGGKTNGALKRLFVLVDALETYLAEDKGLLELALVPVVHEQDGSARLERGEGHLTVSNTTSQS